MPFVGPVRLLPVAVGLPCLFAKDGTEPTQR